MGWLDGQVALITGGGSGIGRAVVERYIDEGAKVCVMDRSGERVDQLKEQYGELLAGVQGDVSLMEDNQKAVQAALDTFGHLDIFVGNAGIFDRHRRLDAFPEDQLGAAFDELFSVNVKGYILGARLAIPHLRSKGGCIIFTASVAGLNSGGGGSLYTASKHAVVGLIRQLAVELGPEIRVNGVAPGGTLTDLRSLETLGESGSSHFNDPGYDERLRRGNPLGLAFQPADIVGPYVLLASKANSGGITGELITVDAGSMLRRNPGT